MKNKIVYIVALLFFLSSCGFKIVKPEVGNYFVSNFKIEGDKKINYKIKRNFYSNLMQDENKKPIDLVLKTKKIKVIKEKNIKNEVEKYLITINLIVEMYNSGKVENFEFSVSGDYNVSDKFSKTIESEEKLINNLCKILSEKLITRLSEKLNDI